MTLKNYLKRFERVALANDFKHSIGLHSLLLREDPSPDCIVFTERDYNYFEAVFGRGYANRLINDCYIINAIEIEPIQLSDDIERYVAHPGRVFTFDYLFIDEKDGRTLKVVKGVVVFTTMSAFVNDYLLPKKIKFQDLSWAGDRTDNDQDISSINDSFEALGFKRLLEFDYFENSGSRLLNHPFSKSKDLSDDYLPGCGQTLLWDERWDEGNWGERYGDTRD